MRHPISLAALLLFFVAATSSVSAPSAVAAAETAPKPLPADSNLVPRDEWMESLVTVLPAVFCARGGYFRSCFLPNEDQCLEHGVRAVKSCLVKMRDELPAQIRQPDEGRAWGQKVGACAGGTFELASKAQDLERKDRKDCGDATKWLPKPPSQGKPAKK